MFRVPLRTWSALAGLLILGHPTLSAQEERPDPKGWFVGYETLEMAMNRFRNFAGEVGYRFGPRYQIRMSVMEVDLTERHLSSSWESAAVDGPGVEGYFRGYELHADRFLKGNWYIGGNVGYYADTYEHVQLPDRVDNETLTVGFGIGYARPAPFGIEPLYVHFAMPFRYYFDQIEETTLGEATVRPHTFVGNIWLFVGFRL